MSRTRLYTDEPLRAGSDTLLRDDAAHYVGRVLRLGPGDEVTLFDGSGHEYPAVIRKVTRSAVTLTTAEGVARDVESGFRIRLLQGISRGERMDFVVQKATELGVTRITPVLTDHAVVRLDAARADKRAAHWRGVAASACEQCGRNILPVIDAPVALRDWLGTHRDDGGTRVILRPGSDATLASIPAGNATITVLVGPEGGFSEMEYEATSAAGFLPVGLGPRILRTETAAVAIVAALQALHGDLA